MDVKRLVELRREAEEAVRDMDDGSMKVKAFEVILATLLGGSFQQPTYPVVQEQERPPKRLKEGKQNAPSATTLTGRILVLKEEGFFKTQKTISQLREELKAHAWHYPVTTLSGALQSLVRARDLRRERGTEGNKKLWKYSNP
jgi:hypothetical protein